MAITMVRPSFGAIGALTAFSLGLVSAQFDGFAVEICASINTADMPRNVSDFQSNGLCHDFCKSEYAFSITQWKNCWCSNYAPAVNTEVDTWSCSEDCPGYPDEKCGGSGLFAYIDLSDFGNAPSGTKGGPKPTSKPDEDEDDSSNDDDVEEPPEPSTLIQTVTAGGTTKIQVITVMPTNTASNEDASNEPIGTPQKDDGLSKGAIAGIAIGVVVIALIAIGGGLFLFFKRRKQQSGDDYQEDPSVRGSSPGAFGSGLPEMSLSGSPNSASNRNSTLAIDPRMDPFKQGLYVRSASHESINTLRDDHDYSRRILRATNPDPGH